jgi:dipeptidyl aminopeptidase/acylaminoacyl peptidase
MRRQRSPRPFRTAALLAGLLFIPAAAAAQAGRPMTFMDVQRLASSGSYTPSGDGRWLLYVVTTPDWQRAESQSDVHVVSLSEGARTSRRLTFTEERDETAPVWMPDGASFLFLSNREGDGKLKQVYLMRLDGGEARKLTEAEKGVSSFDLSPDGRWLVYKSGESDREQLWRLPADALAGAGAIPQPEQITQRPAEIEEWKWAPDGRALYFVTPDSFDEDDHARKDKKFTVTVHNAVVPPSNLWSLDLATLQARQLTREPETSVASITLSKDGRWIGISMSSGNRYERNVTEERLYGDVYLLETATGQIERLTQNREVGESQVSFSPDGYLVAFSAPDDMTRYSMTETRVYVRPTAQRGGTFRKLGADFDGSISIDFWSDDGNRIYFNQGTRVTNQLFELGVETGRARSLTAETGLINVSRDEKTGTFLVRYEDPTRPQTVFTVPSLDRVSTRSAWTELIELNTWTRDLALGETSEFTWKSTDGREVSGVLVKPVGYRAGQRYPLIVQIHGGPAGADVLGFNDGYNSQVFAGDGYAVLMPNYRGSTNYGNAHRTAIVGDYFRLGYDDIMTGVDALIAQGIVDGGRMGALGWSAGGHWSNWILTHTDRFKAISSGAGVANWTSMYAQSDVHRNRQFYMGDGLLYEDNFDVYLNQSPIKYVKNASTPTLFHVVKGDPRVPSPQTVEMHFALKTLGVTTELFMYPGDTHGIPDPRNRLVKAVSEKAWMDHYVRGIGERFQWRQVLETLEQGEKPKATTEEAINR